MISNPVPRFITRIPQELENKIQASRNDIIRCEEFMRQIMHGNVTRHGKQNSSKAQLDQDQHLGLIGLQLLQLLRLKGVEKSQAYQEVETVSGWSEKDIYRVEKVFRDLKDGWTLDDIAKYYKVGEDLFLHQIACVNTCLLNILVTKGNITKTVVYDAMSKYDNGMSMVNALAASIKEDAEYEKYREEQAFITNHVYPTCEWNVDADGKLW